MKDNRTIATSDGSLDPDFTSKGRRPTTSLIPPLYVVNPGLPWLTYDMHGKVIASDSEDMSKVEHRKSKEE
jgi:hypothetical protein